MMPTMIRIIPTMTKAIDEDARPAV